MEDNANGPDNAVDESTPKQTLYINNLNERIKKEELRKSLYAMFSQFGTVMDVVALKTLKMRGQAFVVFRDAASATNAMRVMQNFPLYDKQMKIGYARAKSDAIAKLDGTYVERVKQQRAQKRKAEEEALKEAEQKKQKLAQEGKLEKKRKKEAEETVTGALQPKALPPNKVLFVENLPEQANDLMLQMLFQQFQGFKEVRMVPGKQGIAFVEFESEADSGVAMNGLQHFKVTPTHLMVISYAKKG
jgi:RNA recognition motif-containing protein